MYIYIYMYMHICLCIYIYIERERDMYLDKIDTWTDRPFKGFAANAQRYLKLRMLTYSMLQNQTIDVVPEEQTLFKQIQHHTLCNIQLFRTDKQY